MTTIYNGVYVGPLTHLKGKTALLQLLRTPQVLAQFDDTHAVLDPALLAARPKMLLALSLAFGWHPFAEADFCILTTNHFSAEGAEQKPAEGST
jgi:hypothetical protein